MISWRLLCKNTSRVGLDSVFFVRCMRNFFAANFNWDVRKRMFYLAYITGNTSVSYPILVNLAGLGIHIHVKLIFWRKKMSTQMSTYCHQKRCLRFIPSILVVKCGFYDIYKRKSPASFLSHLENEKNDDDDSYTTYHLEPSHSKQMLRPALNDELTGLSFEILTWQASPVWSHCRNSIMKKNNKICLLYTSDAADD